MTKATRVLSGCVCVGLAGVPALVLWYAVPGLAGPPTGACCQVESCAVTEEAACTGSWYEGESCVVFSCRERIAHVAVEFEEVPKGPRVEHLGVEFEEIATDPRVERLAVEFSSEKIATDPRVARLAVEFEEIARTPRLVHVAVEFSSLEVLFVDATALGVEDGSSWDDAYHELASAIPAAKASGATTKQIWVAAGTYKPDKQTCAVDGDCDGPGGGTCPAGTCVWNSPSEQSFQLLNSLAIYGGFKCAASIPMEDERDDLSDRDPASNPTVLSGDIDGDGMPPNNSFHVVTANGLDATALLDGFTIAVGNAIGSAPIPSGGGILISNAQPTIRACTFSSNSAQASGGAMANMSGSPFVEGCTFFAKLRRERRRDPQRSDQRYLRCGFKLPK